MGYQVAREAEAELEDGQWQVVVKVNAGSIRGARLVLQEAAIRKAVRELGFRCFPRSPGQWRAFAAFIRGKPVDVQLGAPVGTMDLAEALKGEREMSAKKTKKWEWKGEKWDDKTQSEASIRELLEGLRPAIEKIAGGKSVFKGWTSVKATRPKANEENAVTELTVLGAFDKDFAERDDFTQLVVLPVTKLLEELELGPDFHLTGDEAKE